MTSESGVPLARPVTPADPLAPWIGGKRALADRQASLIAGIPHRTYVEPFLGMGGVFLRRRHAPPCEVVNDINRDLVTLFKVAQRHPAALVESLSRWELTSRQLFEEARAMPGELLTDVERAAKFLYLQRLCFGGRVRGRTFGIDLRDGSRLRARQLAQQIRALSRRLDGVIIECLSWPDVLERYDRPETLFYLDPPYFGSEADYGKGIFGESDFDRLGRRLRALQGRFVLSINDTPAARRIFGGFAIEEVALTYSISAHAGEGTAARELIVRDGKSDAAGPLFG